MSNLNYNKVILAGRIATDLELKVTPNGIPSTSFSIAVSRKVNNETVSDFFNCIAWRGTAELISKYFKKGNSILVTGSLQNRKWEDKQGQKHFSYDIIVNEACFVDSKADNIQNQTKQQHFENLANDEDLPF